MKRQLITFAALIMAALSLQAAPKSKVTKADDSRIVYVGRTLVQNGEVSFDWSAVTARTCFEGQYLAMKCSDTKKNYYNVWIDSDVTGAEVDKVIYTTGTDTLIVIATAEDFAAKAAKMSKADKKKYLAGAHKVTIQKRTEGEQGTTTIKEFITEGEMLQAEALKSRMIEFVGDSYTCGYGSENSVASDPFKPETENVNKSYCEILARHFDADAFIVAHSGMGIARNYNSKFAGYYMPDRYNQVFDMDEKVMWDAKKSAFAPAITVIYLGTNDFSVSTQPSLASFKKHYHQLLSEIKANYGEDHPILCVSSKADVVLFDYVRASVETCGLKNVHFLGIFEGIHYNDDRNLGASFHPNYSGHHKIAAAMMPYVATLAGWDCVIE